MQLQNIHWWFLALNKGCRYPVQKNLKQYNFVKSIHHPEEQDGGQGVTIVEFK